MMVVGVVAPGAMGAVVGGCLVDKCRPVLWASDRRSDTTPERAGAAGLQDVGDLDALCRQADILLSICPPHAAVPAASALKVAYAAWTKGSAALLLTVRAYAQAEGVAEHLLAEWELSQAELPGRVGTLAETASPKAWRWIAEMQETAAAFDAVGLPPDYHQGAAATYARLEARRDLSGTTVDEVVRDLLGA